MAFTSNMTAAAQVDDSVVLEFDQQFIVAATEMGVMDQFVTYKKDIGAKSIQLPKYAQLALATTALDEDDDITSEALSDSQILFTPAEHGNSVTRTLLASLQTGGTVDRAAARLVGMNQGRTYDKLAILAAEASGNEFFPGSVASEAALVAGDIMTVTFLNKLYNKLSRTNVLPLQNGMYIAIMHDDVIHDLRNSAGAGSWSDINKYARPEEVLRNEVGMLAGFRIIRDNLISVNADAGDSAVDSYHTLCMGFNALGKVESKVPTMVMSGPYDKLGRFINIGWHGAVKYGIVDTDALLLGTTASSVGVNV